MTELERKNQTAEIVKKFGGSAANTGSTEVQIANLTHRIKYLNGHFADHKKDHASKRGLLKMIGQRRRLLRFLKNTDQKRYSTVLAALDLRK